MSSLLHLPPAGAAVLGHAMNSLTIVATLAATLVLYWALRRRAFLSEFPGPSSASWLEIWMMRASVSKRQNLKLWECSEKYGPYARIGPKTLLVSDPDFLYEVNSVRGSFIRSSACNAFRLEVGRNNILSSRDEARHMYLRTKMAGGYTRRENPGLEASVDSHVTKLLDLLNEKYLRRPGAPLHTVDFSKTLGYFTLDVVTDIAFGRSAGYLEANADKFDFFSNVQAFVPVMSLTAVLPQLIKITEISWINKKLAPKSSDAVGIGKIMGLAKEAVEERYTGKHTDRLDMLASFKRHGLTQREAEAESVFQILAGTDTTATALRGILLYLTTTPSVAARLRAELAQNDLLPSTASALPTKEVVTAEILSKLPYLAAVVKEGLRLHPPATGYLEKESPPGGCTLPDGRHVPAGTGLAYNAWGIMRSRAVFGDDADIYRPERWLESETEPEKLRAMTRSWELGFATGKWRCLGKDIAYMEINKVVAEFTRRYDLTVADPGRPWDCTNWGLWLVRDYLFVVNPRN